MTISRMPIRYFAFIIGLLAIGVTFAMNLFHTKSPLSSPWRERFADVATLNEYAKSHPVDIADAVIENKNIDGVMIQSGKIENTEWKNVKAKNAHFSNVTFHEGIIEDVDFSHSVLTDVVFENMRLVEARFFHATLKNVRFVNCTFNGSNIDQTIKSNIEVVDSKVINTSLSEGQLVAVFRNSQLYKGTSLTDLEPPSSLTFEKCELSEVNMDRSKIEKLIVDDGNFDTTLKVGSADIIKINNADVDTSFSATKIGYITVEGSLVNRLVMNRAKIHSLSAKNCSKMNNLVMYEAKIDSVDIESCPLTEFYPAATNIGVMSIKDCAIKKGIFERMRAKTLTLENVSLSGEIDFSKSHIINFQMHNVTKKIGLKLKTDDSNVKF